MAITHEELLDKIKSFTCCSGASEVALLAVIELHKPEPFGLVPSGFICAGCDNRCGCYEGDILSYNDWFTCPTIKAIEKELS